LRTGTPTIANITQTAKKRVKPTVASTSTRTRPSGEVASVPSRAPLDGWLGAGTASTVIDSRHPSRLGREQFRSIPWRAGVVAARNAHRSGVTAGG
jgi:hypothetical protein